MGTLFRPYWCVQYHMIPYASAFCTDHRLVTEKVDHIYEKYVRSATHGPPKYRFCRVISNRAYWHNYPSWCSDRFELNRLSAEQCDFPLQDKITTQPRHCTLRLSLIQTSKPCSDGPIYFAWRAKCERCASRGMCLPNHSCCQKIFYFNYTFDSSFCFFVTSMHGHAC